MITIGITVCDSDYTNVENLFAQIRERVEPEHEIIIVDNREKFKDEPVPWKADWAPGYNAYQFEARRRIVDMAHGEYIWFVDGDDEILGLHNNNYTEDIIAYSFYAYPDDLYIVADEVITEDLMNLTVFDKIVCSLWNKLIKKSVLEQYKGIMPENHKSVSLEDVAWSLLALSKSKSVRLSSEVIYHHVHGASNSQYITSPSVIKMMTTGYRGTQDCMKRILADYPEMYEKMRKRQSDYFCGYIPKMAMWPTEKTEENVIEVARTVMEAVDKDILAECFSTRVFPYMPSIELIEVATKELVNFLDESEAWPTTEIIEEYWDEETEQWKERKQKVVNKVEVADFTNTSWDKKLSIVCLVYDGNVHYLDSFIKMIQERVRVDYEIVVVDNREDKTSPLDVPQKAVLVETSDGNIGILNGRRLGVNAATGDYIWLVDIDDEIAIIMDKDWGDSDIIVFPYIEQDGKMRNYTGTNLQQDSFFEILSFVLISSYLWNKWVRSDVLKRAYKIVPSFRCIYHEDNLLYFPLMECAKSVKFPLSHAIYKHINHEDSTTTKHFSKEKDIDRLFTGFDKVSQFLTRYSKHKKLLDFDHMKSVEFYLWLMMHRTNPDVRQYFADTLVRLFGHETILQAKDDLWYEEWVNDIDEWFTFPNYGPPTCLSAGSIEISCRENGMIKFWKCCKLHPVEVIGAISFKNFMALENKHEYLDSKSRFIPPKHKYFNTNATGVCRGCKWCDYSKTPLNRITVISNSCNLRCSMCREDVYCSQDESENYFGLLEAVRGMALEELFLTNGGEPFLHKERTLKYIESLTEKDFKIVGCITNGTTLDDEDIERLANLTNVGFFSMVSVDGITEETYEKVRRNPYFKKVKHNILELNKHGLLRGISVLITEDNLHELNDMPEYWMSNGLRFDQLTFIVCEDVYLPSSSNSEKKIMRSKELQEFLKKYPTIDITFPGDNDFRPFFYNLT